jgi:hypothetical protein
MTKKYAKQICEEARAGADLTDYAKKEYVDKKVKEVTTLIEAIDTNSFTYDEETGTLYINT